MAVELSTTQSAFQSEKTRDLLRLATAGSVDDGKSTLIGRLLYDTDSLPLDHLAAVRQADGELDFAALSDGLHAEREQGITIDVAYRYFSSPQRNYILADTPGHELYTRNMFTGASTADVAILLIDAEKGVLRQTRRHAKIADLLGVKYIIAAINKMDRIDYDQTRYQAICADVDILAKQLNHSIIPIPLAAKLGENIVRRSVYTPWYTGPTLFEFLENLEIGSSAIAESCLPIQGVIRSQNEQKRRYTGRIESGSFRIGDTIVALPSGATSTITALDNLTDNSGYGITGQSVALELADERDIGRGNVLSLAGQHEHIHITSTLTAIVCWFHSEKLHPGKQYSIKLATQTVRGEIGEIISLIDLEDFTHNPAVSDLSINDIGEITLDIHGILLASLYKHNAVLGSFIIIDEQTQQTAGAGFVTHIIPKSQNEFTGKYTNESAIKILTSGNTGIQSGAIILIANQALFPDIIDRLSAYGLSSYQLNADIIEHDSQYFRLPAADREAYLKILALRLADAGVYALITDSRLVDAFTGLDTRLVDRQVPILSVQSLPQLQEYLDLL